MAKLMRILLVEDTPSDVRLTRESLKDLNLEYELFVVNDGEQAMEYFRKTVGTDEQPDLVLLDLNMPRKNGHEVLAEVKDMEALKRTPIVLLTVSNDEHDIMKALNAKMNYYLSKPVTSDKLNVLLRAIHDLATSDTVVKPVEGEDAHVRYVMAGNPHTSPAILQRLAAEQIAGIRMRVAENPHAPIEVLEKLSQDESPEVRVGVVENPSVPVHLLAKLAKDENEDVRLAVASNPRVPVEILRQLSIDTNGYVMSIAQRTLDALGAHPTY